MGKASNLAHLIKYKSTIMSVSWGFLMSPLQRVTLDFLCFILSAVMIFFSKFESLKTMSEKSAFQEHRFVCIKLCVFYNNLHTQE